MGGIPIQLTPRLAGGTGRIEGVVRDSDTGKPITGATVLIRPCGVLQGSSGYGADQEWRPFFITGDDGAFHLDGLPEGRFEIEASGRGYLPHRCSPLMDLHGTEKQRRPSAFDILWHSSGRWDEAWNEKFGGLEVIRNHFPLVSTADPTRITVSLRAGQVITGRVRDTSGKVVPGATVESALQRITTPRGCFDMRDMASADADGEGRFELTVFPREALELRVVAEGFTKLQSKIDPLTHDPVELTLTPGTRLRGRVVGPDGLVVQRTRVVAFSPSDPESGVMTDSYDGAWTLEDAPPAPLTVIAWHGYAGGALAEVHDPAIELNLVLTPLKTARGRVVDLTGAPVEGVFITQVFGIDARWKLSSMLSMWDIGEMAKTDADGRFSLNALPDAEGKALLQFDYHFDPARVDLGAEIKLVISQQTSEHRELNRKYMRMPEPEPPPPRAGLGPTPLPDLSPAQIEERNRKWIELLKTAPPKDRVQLLSDLRDQACGHNWPDPRPSSERIDLLPVFEAGVDNDDDNTRFWAISCIHYMNRRENLPLLIKYLEHSDPSIRSYAITGVKSLAVHPDLKERAIEALREALKRERESWEVALGAACALARLGANINPRRFADALKVDGIDHRIAAQGLGILGCKESIELILHRFQRADTWNSHQFWTALESITGQKLGREPGPWREWLDANRPSLPVQWT